MDEVDMLMEAIKTHQNSQYPLERMNRTKFNISKFGFAAQAVEHAAASYEAQMNQKLFKYSDLLEATRRLLEEEANGQAG